MEREPQNQNQQPPAELTADLSVLGDIVTVDARGRGHRPAYNGIHDPQAPGGQFLSNHEMNMISANAGQILGDAPSVPEDPGIPDEPDVPGDDPETPPTKRPDLRLAPDPDDVPSHWVRDPSNPWHEYSWREPAEEPSPDTTSEVGPHSILPAPYRIRARKAAAAAAEAKGATKLTAARADTAKGIHGLTRARGLGAEGIDESEEILDPKLGTDIEVLEEVRGIQGALLKSKYLRGFARAGLRAESFTLQEYHSGVGPANHGSRQMAHGPGHGAIPNSIRGMGDRRAPRFIVKKRIKGVVVPHAINSEDRGRDRLPDARKSTTPESKRRDALVMATNGRDSWAGGLHGLDRSKENLDQQVIAVGAHRALSVIGIDARRLRLGTRRERTIEKSLNTIGIDRRLTPNAAARGMEAATDGNPGRQADIATKLAAIRNRWNFMRLRAAGLVSPRAIAPAVAPHPRHRRHDEWQGWGTNDVFRTPGRSGTIPTPVAGPPPRVVPRYAPRDPSRRVI